MPRSKDLTPKISFWSNLKNIFKPKIKTRPELVQTIRNAAAQHLIENDILNMFEGVLNLQELKIREVMIPRAQIISIQENLSFNEIVQIVVDSGHSRFPIIGKNKDSILGLLLAKDLIPYTLDSQANNFKLQSILRPVLFVPESKRLGSLLHEFQTKHNHIAIVIDEYGCITGLITIEDVIEQIVGEIEDEYDTEHDEPSIKKVAENCYNIKAVTSIEDFNEFFGVDFDGQEAETIGGLVLRILGKMPKRGEGLVIEGMFFQILRADSRKIHSIKVIPAQNNEI